MAAAGIERAAEFLAQVAVPERQPLNAGDVAVVVAHPDDETIGCGALLQRLAGVCVVVITDGAPRDLVDARAYGFDTADGYAKARTSELQAALRIAGVPACRVTQLGIPDQGAIRNLGGIAEQLYRSFERQNISLVLTHAYEGGHPDHDSTAFCVHQAAQLSSKKIAIVEMPYYRAGEAGAVQQSFAPGGNASTVTSLTEQERCRKQQMIAAYKTQASVLAGFSVDTEQFRRAPDYDFRQLPNGGRVLYERENWGRTGEDWLSAVNKYFAQDAVAA